MHAPVLTVVLTAKIIWEKGKSLHEVKAIKWVFGIIESVASSGEESAQMLSATPRPYCDCCCCQYRSRGGGTLHGLTPATVWGSGMGVKACVLWFKPQVTQD